MRNKLFVAFRRGAKLFSGHRLRDRVVVIDKLYKYLNYKLSPLKITVHDHYMYLDKGDSMGLAVDGIYEPMETRLVQDYVEPDQAVVDIGANIGYYTLIFARIVSPSGRVFAFEPDIDNFNLLHKNIEVNKYENVVLIQKAVSNHTGESKLYLDRFSNLDHRLYKSSNDDKGVSIRTVRLDDYFNQMDIQIDFIKIDIQGAEGLALEGMMTILERNQNIKILAEFWPFGLEKAGTTPSSFLEFLNDLGFIFHDVSLGVEAITPVTAHYLLTTYTPEKRNHTNLLCMKEND